MRKVFLDDLPKWKNSSNKGKINWEKCIGCKIKFIYDNIEGKIKIISYYYKIINNRKRYFLDIKYKKNICHTTTSDLKKCRLGNILQLHSNIYIYKVNDIIQTSTENLKILKQIKIIHNSNIRKTTYDKGYEYECLNCGNIDTITEFSLKRNQGCNVCNHRKVVKGINDMWTTNPNLAKLLYNSKDGYEYTQNSEGKVDWKCPNCGNIIKNKRIGYVNIHGLSCSKCGDGVSYPEKLMYSVLEQLYIKFQTQLSRIIFKWCGKYKYDFYFKINNEEYIIETHGRQHYEKGFQRIKSNKKIKTVEEEQENDKLKKELAIINNIKEENYIIIDCRKSELEFIKNNILNSRLNEIFDLSQIDWLKCHEFAYNSRVKEACDLWNNGIHSTKEIGEKMHLSPPTILKYLKQGSSVNLCNYNTKIAKQQMGKKIKKIKGFSVICLNDNKIFESLTEASITMKVDRHKIKDCCCNKILYAGENPITGEPLKWMYYNDYIKLKDNINILHNEDNISV